MLAGSSVAFAARPPNEASYDPLRRSVDASGGCMVDAACEPAWTRAARGVVALLIDRSICSGTLINTLGGRREKPLLLTAFHCVRALVEQRIAAARRARAAALKAPAAPAASAANTTEVSAEALAGLAGLVPLHALFNWESTGCGAAAAELEGARPPVGLRRDAAGIRERLGFALELEEMPAVHGAHRAGPRTPRRPTAPPSSTTRRAT